MGSQGRLKMLLDDGVWVERDATLASTDPLQFQDLKAYQHRLEQAQQNTGLSDALVTAEGRLGGQPVIICAMEYGFIGGSMGAVAHITQAQSSAARV